MLQLEILCATNKTWYSYQRGREIDSDLESDALPLRNPGIVPVSLMSPALAGSFFTTEPCGKPIKFLGVTAKALKND